MTIPSKRIPIIVVLIALGTVLAVLSITHPEFLAHNKMLNDFVAGDLLVFLVVPLTVTMTVVSAVHVQISDMIRRIRNPERRRRLETDSASPLRTEINSSVWLLFWTFVVCLVTVAVKGQFETNEYVLSFAHSIAIVAVAINAIVLYDVHATIFALAPVVTAGKDDDEGHNTEGGAGER